MLCRKLADIRKPKTVQWKVARERQSSSPLPLKLVIVRVGDESRKKNLMETNVNVSSKAEPYN